MRGNIRLLVVIVAVVFPPLRAYAAPSQSASASAFQATVDQVGRQLRSGDPKEVAWGAALAVQHQIRGALPLIEAALARTYEGPDVVRWATELTLLDALVQLDARLPAASVVPHLERWPVQSLILLAKASSAADDMLLPLVSSTSGFTWYAAANLLLRTRPSGFAFRLLDGLRLKLTVQVGDTDASGPPSGGMNGTSRGCNVGVAAPGFPQIAEYLFSGKQSATDIVAPGPVDVYYLRRISPTAGTFGPPCLLPGSSPLHLDRVRYTNALVERNLSAVRFYESNHAGIQWTNAQGFQARLTEHRRRVEDTYRDVVSLLVRSGDLTEREASQLAPEVEVIILDRRTSPSEPLPPAIR